MSLEQGHDDPTQKTTAKSLFFCLAVGNPFYYPVDPASVSPGSSFVGNEMNQQDARTGLQDEDFAAFQHFQDLVSRAGDLRIVKVAKGARKETMTALRTALHQKDSIDGREAQLLELQCRDAAVEAAQHRERDQRLRSLRHLGGGDLLVARRANHGLFPTRYQKLIELLLRLNDRRVAYFPNDLLEPCDAREVDSETPSTENIGAPDLLAEEQHDRLREAEDKRMVREGMQWRGYRLREDRMVLSPDRDEAYLQLHFSEGVLRQFAERQGIILISNPYSLAGGDALPYNEELERKLAESVARYAARFPVPEEYAPAEGKRPCGFVLEIPQKMRLAARMLREGWEFGGCGFPVDELRRKQVFVTQFFPQHNRGTRCGRTSGASCGTSGRTLRCTSRGCAATRWGSQFLPLSVLSAASATFAGLPSLW